ncbi:MAG TPA: O-antigen ligase family protein [Solirubrobacterales bacterium]
MAAGEGRSLQSGKAVMIGALMAALAGLFFWWAWRQGAYFGSVFYPGAIGVFLLVALLMWFAPISFGASRPALVAFGALAALAIWTSISLLWTPSRGAAVTYAEHAFLYVALFCIGAWLCSALVQRPTLALLPVAIGGIAVAIAVVFTLADGHHLSLYFHGEATLRLPLGYRNADAAFFLICLWPVLALAFDRERNAFLRVALVGGATALVELALLCESRGSVPALLVAVLAWVAFSPSRLRGVGYLVLLAIPVAIATPTLLNVFHHGELKGLAPAMHQAAGVIALTVLLALGLALVTVFLLEPRIRPSNELHRGLELTCGAIALIVAVIGMVAFFHHEGGPSKFFDQRLEQFKAGGITDFSGSEARFGANVGSNRNDFWRVSVDQAERTPILGVGAGSFAITYLQHRRSPETPRDPHSVEMLFLDELGFPGLAMFVIFVGAVIWGATRARRAGPGAALAVAGAVTGVVYWTMHASYDWLWNYPIVTGLMAFLAGVAVTSGVRAAVARRERWLPRGVAIGALVVAVVAVPLFLAERYIDRGFEEQETDPTAALRDFARAADLNPWDAGSLLAKGTLAASIGDRATAIKALTEAEGREPEGYASHFFLATVQEDSDPAEARRQIAIARRLNPHEGEVIAAYKRINAPRPRRGQGGATPRQEK